MYCMWFYCNTDIFQIYEKRERDRENEESAIKVYTLHLRLKN